MIRKALTIIFAVFLINTIISSCCTETYLIDGIEFSGVRLISDHGEDLHKYYSITDTLKERIVFGISYKLEQVAGLNLIQSDCYATSCAIEYINSLQNSSYILTSNKGIIVEGDSIKPGENWWTNARIKKYIHYFQNANDVWYIEFKDDFKMNSTIEKGNYKFYFECQTDDNKTFNDSINIVIDLI
jgi:hypothetical protein